MILLALVICAAAPSEGYVLNERWSLRDIVREIEPSVVWIYADLGNGELSQGSGFVIHEDGYIVTNAHVIEGASMVIVGWPNRFNRSEQIAEVVATDSAYDLAILHIDCVHLSAIPFDNAGSACLGDAVVALGYPAGTSLGLGDLTVTRGVVSALRRDETGDVALIQTDAVVTLGCSGGPLYDIDTGSVIGIVEGMGMLVLEGFNFAIPSSKLFDFAGTDANDGMDSVIGAVRNVDADFSHPGLRSLSLYESALSARERAAWGEALSSFLAADRIDGEDPQVAYGVAESYAALLRPRESLRWLERAFELGYSDFDNALDSDGFAVYEEDDRFVELVQSF